MNMTSKWPHTHERQQMAVNVSLTYADISLCSTCSNKIGHTQHIATLRITYQLSKCWQ